MTCGRGREGGKFGWLVGWLVDRSSYAVGSTSLEESPILGGCAVTVGCLGGCLLEFFKLRTLYTHAVGSTSPAHSMWSCSNEFFSEL